MRERHLVPILVVIALLLVPIGIALWVQAGTRHSEDLPATAELVRADQQPPGPDRTPAILAWVAAGSAVVVAAGVAARRRAE